ncbi:hypothetical protein J8847_02925 [Massilia sp. AB1]|nr:hypothetical protein [Massilia sp. AB1]MBQ5962478.1 hypothetical protein [Massilia sp. ZL223]
MLSAGLIGASALSPALAAEPIHGWKSIPGAIYLIHGGSLADRQPATVRDRKLSIVVDGPPAKEMFDAIGPDLPESCSGEKGDRVRDKKGVYCSYSVRDKASKEGPYRCWIGIDLRTGDSVGTVSC